MDFSFYFKIPYIYVITLVATRNLVFSHSKTLSTEHIGVSTKRRFGTTSFGYGDNGEPLRGRQNNMKNILVALAIFMEQHKGNFGSHEATKGLPRREAGRLQPRARVRPRAVPATSRASWKARAHLPRNFPLQKTSSRKTEAEYTPADVEGTAGPDSPWRRSSRVRPLEPWRLNLTRHVVSCALPLNPVWYLCPSHGQSEPTVRPACRPCGSALSLSRVFFT